MFPLKQAVTGGIPTSQSAAWKGLHQTQPWGPFLWWGARRRAGALLVLPVLFPWHSFLLKHPKVIGNSVVT